MGKNKKRIIITIGILFFCLFSSLLFAVILITRPSIQQHILKSLSKRAGYTIDMKNMGISLIHGIGIEIKKLSIQPKNKSFRLSCPNVSISYKPINIIKGDLIPERVVMEKPDIVIDKNKISSKRAGKVSDKKIFLIAAAFSSFSIKDGKISIKGEKFGLDNINIRIRREEAKKIYILFKTNLMLDSYRFPFYADGVICEAPSRLIKAELDLKINDFPLAYIDKKGPLFFIRGNSNSLIKLNISSDGRISGKGSIFIKDMDFILEGSDNQKTEYKLDEINIDFCGNYLNKTIRFHSSRISGKDFELYVNSTINLRQKPPFVSVDVKSPYMSIISFKRIFPTCFLPEWLEKRLFPIIKKGRVKVEAFSINGTIDQIEHMDSPKNKGVLYGELIMDRLWLWPEGARYPLKDIMGSVCLVDGDLLIKNLKASFGSSVIKDALLKIKDIFQNSRHYYIQVNGSFDLEDLMAQANMEFTPKAIIRQLKDIRKISGRMDAHVKCEYEGSWDVPIFNNSAVILRECNILHNAIKLPIHIRNGKFWIDPDGIYHFNGNGLFGKSLLYASAKFDSLFKQLDMKSSGNLYIADILKPYLKDNLDFQGSMNIKVHIKKRDDIWDTYGNLALNKFSMKITSLSLSPCNSKIEFSVRYITPKEKLIIKKFEFKSKRSKFFAAGTYRIIGKTLSLKFVTKRLFLEDLGIKYKNMKESIKGRLITKLKINSCLKNPLYTFIYGPFRADHLSIRSKEVKIIDTNMKLNFFGKKVSINSIDTNLGRYPVHINGKIAGWDGLKGNLSILFDYIDLPKLKFGGGAAGGKNSFIKKSDLIVALNIARGKCSKIVFEPIKVNIRIKKEDLYIKDFVAYLPSGTIKTNGYIKDNETCFDSYIKLKGMPLEDILTCIGINKYLDGKLNMDSHIYSKSKDINGLISRLNGKVDILLSNGKIYKSQPVLKILDFLSLSNLWKFNPLSFFEKGVPFNKIKIESLIKNGVISFDKMVMNSKALNAAGKGNLDLNKKRIDLGVAIQPLGTVDAIIGKLPIVGYIIGGKEKKISLYYFEVKGPLNNIKIKQVPLKNLVKGTLNLFKRILLTPTQIIEDLGG